MLFLGCNCIVAYKFTQAKDYEFHKFKVQNYTISGSEDKKNTNAYDNRRYENAHLLSQFTDIYGKDIENIISKRDIKGDEVAEEKTHVVNNVADGRETDPSDLMMADSENIIIRVPRSPKSGRRRNSGRVLKVSSIIAKKGNNHRTGILEPLSFSKESAEKRFECEKRNKKKYNFKLNKNFLIYYVFFLFNRIISNLI